VLIDDEMKAFLESEIDVFVGSRDELLVPSTVRGWGPRVSVDGASVELFIDMPAGNQPVANFRSNGRVAVVFTHPMTNRSIQLKGRCLEIGDPVSEDWAWIERHRTSFARTVAHFGYPAHLVRNLWSMQVKRVRLSVEAAFNQTPGPGAGARL
jgi:hypothetical protein